jgi:hypothetical protein
MKEKEGRREEGEMRGEWRWEIEERGEGDQRRSREEEEVRKRRKDWRELKEKGNGREMRGRGGLKGRD